jgi:hypothetical protein
MRTTLVLTATLCLLGCDDDARPTLEPSDGPPPGLDAADGALPDVDGAAPDAAEVADAAEPDATEDAPAPPADSPLDAGISPAYVVPFGAVPGVTTRALLTADEVVPTGPMGGAYAMAGVPDGLGAFDNGDGTFTLLMNHELGFGEGRVHAHGAAGAFVSRWILRTSDLAVLRGEDLIQRVVLWNRGTRSFDPPAAGVALGKFCAADLPVRSAVFNRASGRGYDGWLFFSPEETGTEGRLFAHALDGTSYELPGLGRANWENVLLHPDTGDQTVSVGLDDSYSGELYVYVGSKSVEGSPAARAGLVGGQLYGVKVEGVPEEGAALTTPVPFTLHPFGDVANLANPGDPAAPPGAYLDAHSGLNGVTGFQRPEDGAWDPSSRHDFYFATTASHRLWRLRFTDVSRPELGGTIVTVVDGRGLYWPDNLTISPRGEILVQGDPGGEVALAGVWRYHVATDTLEEVARADAEKFLPEGRAYLDTTAEEASGILDMTGILGPGHYLHGMQTHFAPGIEQGGQLMHLFVPPR